MKLCIDTNIYSAFKRGNQDVVDLLEKTEEVLIPAIVLGELYAGFNLGRHMKKNLSELYEFLKIPGIYVVEIDDRVAERYGNIIQILKNQGTPIPTNDIWIAATSIENNAKLLSCDKHFEHIPGSMLLRISV